MPGHSAALMPEPEGGLFGGGLIEETAADFVHSLNPEGNVAQLFGSSRGLFLGDSDEQSAATFTPPGSGLPLYFTTILPQVRIGGQPVPVLFSGLAPGLTGVWQINILVPAQTPTGKLPVTIDYDGTELRSIDVLVK